MKTYFYTTVLIITILLPLSTHADTFCVSDATGLQTALTTAAGNGENDTIQIEQGTYMGSFIYASTEAFNLTVEGGYTSSCSSRVVDPTNTVLDGNNTSVVLVLSAPDYVADFLVGGVTVQNGVASGNRGGIYTNTEGEVIISNNIIRSNSAQNSAGGVYINNGTVTLTSNTINNNNSSGYTGGIFINSNGSVTLTSNIISDNSGRSGGGVYINSNGTVNLTSNIISDNSGQSGGGGGAGGLELNSNGTVTLTSNTINNNNANGSGGGVYINSPVSGTFTLVNNTISYNTAQNNAGGIYFGTQTGTFALTNNTINNNNANGSGGGILLILSSDNVISNIYNNIIWNNSAGNEGGDLYIENDNNDNFIPSTVNLYNNNFDQSAGGTYIHLPFTIDSSNLDNEDPLFVDAPNDDYHLTDLSPCIDAGSLAEAPPDDMDGHPRPQGDGVDIGADEYIPPDADDDGVPNDEDNCPLDANPAQTDTDHDCIGDVCDDFPNDYDPTVPDSDGDGMGNACDVCPYDFDDDIDADGLCGNEDNCPDIPNGPDLGSCVNILTGIVGATCLNDGECGIGETCSNNQEDRNNNGAGDACDIGTFCRGLADYDQDVDGGDVGVFISHFGRSQYHNPCPPDGPSPVPQTGRRHHTPLAMMGDHQRGVALMAPRFTDNGSGTVTDNQTGLMWLKDANCLGQRTWSEALSDCNGLASGSCGLTDGSNSGDWRLPNYKELISLIDVENYNPALPTGHPFSNVQSVDNKTTFNYWSSSTIANVDTYAWTLFTHSGDMMGYPKTNIYFIWPVRGGH